MQPRSRDSPERSSSVGARGAGHARAGLGAEILDDDFLDVAVAPVQIAQWRAAPRGAPARVSPMPMRMPVVKGTACSPAAAIVASRRWGPCRASRNAGSPRRDRAARRALQHEPHRDRRPGAGGRCRPPSSRRGSRAAAGRSRRITERAHVGEIVERAGRDPMREARRARGGIAQLRLVARA